ncbi:hypothetical protein SELMODRAFT_183867 [Selaginella moellendorffii]|uniref:NADH:flavin oxidoreductase/NADH oxidase N-terminal domain-containing protein n=1 Tax=Selaginella moellendorffii TaxID=88036 RepID=D8SYH6_SELML|nr:putative 12-oxophytodienoate reductase 11 [Selaginella moellendorffii]EFJ10525.1 hypothetical protein SELMODRAFT_183867 [Selaginella moellendorffii]|eukprot:XP_002988435.1 putative 12-oxophytodienoate reductase 11 [Selaginella moellendorffii]
MESSSNPLMEPFQLGPFALSHRVVLAPVTRCRATDHIPQPANVLYYSQRASPGGLLISEAAAVSQQGIGWPHSPGIWSDEQVQAWKPVVKAVHDKGAIFFCQLWHVGRASHTCFQPRGQSPVSSTNNPLPPRWTVRLPDGTPVPCSAPRALQTDEIPQLITDFQLAARNALAAGFDGVEIHAAHGYLLDQFLKDGINDRDDSYGGSIANRSRLVLEILEAICREAGPQRTAVRISPIIDHLGATDSDPVALAHHLVAGFVKLGVLYLHATEPAFSSSKMMTEGKSIFASSRDWNRSLGFLRESTSGSSIAFLCSGGFTKELGNAAIQSGYADLVAYGRLFISNPDLPARFARHGDVQLNPYNRATFYTHHPVLGYIDYPCMDSRDEEEEEDRKKHPSKL